MAAQRKRVDITSADSQQLGFDYQYLYFIVKLFQLSHDEEVGYEALDDVHVISFCEQKTFFYQLKHTISKTASGQQPNLTNLSEDLWKTLSNWSKLILDSSEGREQKAAQKEFICKSNFVFVANRNLNDNDLITNTEKLKSGEIVGKDFLNYLKQLTSKSKDITVKRYIENVMKLGVSVMERFVKHIEFKSAPNNLVDSIREGIRDKMIPEKYVNDVLSDLYLQLKEDFFEKVTNGQHQTISYSEWITKYQGVFNKYRTTQLPLRTYSPALPDHLESQVFVKELIEIGAIKVDEYGLSEIAELTDHYLQVKLQLEAWYQDGRITYLTVKQFHKDAILQWKNIHRACHRSTNQDKKLDFQNALACFDKIMMAKLTILSTELGVAMSNGEFIKLADENKIGWKYSWTERYYTNGN